VTGNLVGNAAQHLPPCFLGSPFDGVAETVGIGRAMALDDDALEPEQAGTVVATMIDAALEALEHR